MSEDRWLTHGGPILEELTVTPASFSLAASASQQMTAAARYSDGRLVDVTASITWSVVDTGVATVSASGLVTAHAVGVTTVVAHLGAAFANAALLVGGDTTFLYFRHTVVAGASDFFVPLPVVLGSGDYGVTVSLVKGGGYPGFELPVEDRVGDMFRVLTAGDLATGDELDVLVVL